MTTEIILIVKALDRYMTPNLFMGIKYPNDLFGEFINFSEEKKELWYSYTFNELIGPCAINISNELKRSLEINEIQFIKERMEGFIKEYIYSGT